ncbi:MAG: hypothetical protein EPO40_22715 [Myxococcaceae bacterium]|nr:MAG: hypothetical protein EPO40_22715 [Myxococcaceae bacterium]
MRSQRASLRHLSLVALSLVAACSSPRSSGNTPVETDASADVTSDLAVDVAPAVDVPDDRVAADAPGDATAADAVDAAADVGDDVLPDTGTDVPEDVAVAVDAPADVPVDVPADVPADVPPLACRSDRECGARAQVCERTLGICVDCLTAVDCTGTEICAGNRCVPAPPPCRSDRDCSARMQVCNPTRMLCVDCNTAVDCPPNNVCNPDGTCAPQACVPSSVTCADTSTVRVCSADGRTFTSTPCPAVANGVSRCGEGACTTACNPGFADCDGNAANGCETSTLTSEAACGRCGNVCPSAGGSAACVAGSCTLTCSAGRGDCDGSAANGCETNLGSSNAHCGRCGGACGAGLTCTDGTCALTGCPSGQTRCSGTCVDLNANVAQCGACGRACSLPNATPACTSGSCVVATCSAGFGDCDGSAANGCETDTRTTTSSCGACGNICPVPQNSIPACVGGSCGIFCATGFGSCDGSNANGCEVSLTSSNAHCGACGRACSTGQTCVAGACVSNTCGTGLTPCPGNVCRDLARDPANCGACGRACAAGQLCTASTCVSTPLRFALTWNVTADLDISVLTPGGTVVSYASRTGGGGTFDTDSMAMGPEQIYWTAPAPAGTYYVCVIPYRVTSATSYTLQAFRGATLAATRSGSHTANAPSGSTCSATSPYMVLAFVP